MIMQRRLQRTERELVRAHDAAHRRGQHRHLLRRQGPHHSDLERLHLGQPGHRLRVRSHQVRPPGRDARRRRGRAVPDRGDGVRYAVRHEPAQRSAAHHAASLRPRSRRPGGRRRRGHAGARRARARAAPRRAHSRRASRASPPTPTACMSPSRKSRRCASSWSWRWRTRGSRPTRSATSTAMARRPSTATSPKRARRRRLFGPRMPISSQKSYLGHTLGACGALEAWFSIEMMKAGWFAPTLNLDNIDPRCGELDYITGEGRALRHRLRDEQQLRVRRREHVDGVQALEMSGRAGGSAAVVCFGRSAAAHRLAAWRADSTRRIPESCGRAGRAATERRRHHQSLRRSLPIPGRLRRGAERRSYGAAAFVARRASRRRCGRTQIPAVIASMTLRSRRR